MKFYDYLDTIYFNGNIESQQTFDLMTQAKTNQAIALIRWQRTWFKRFATITLILSFFKAKLTGAWPQKVALPSKPTIVKDNNDQVETLTTTKP